MKRTSKCKKNGTLLLSLLVFMCLHAQSQKIPSLNVSMNGHFEYSIKGMDTVCQKFFLCSEYDTINLIDEHGVKQGKWIYPFYQSRTLKYNSFAVYKLNDQRLLHKLDSFSKHQKLSFELNHSSGISQLMYIVPTFSDTQSHLFIDNTDKDPVLLVNEKNRVIRDGFYLEVYWFGVLYGSYKNGSRINRWHYLPLSYQNACLVKTVDFDVLNEQSASLFRINDTGVAIKEIRGFESGQYQNDSRIGRWTIKMNDSGKSMLSHYRNGQLECLTMWGEGLTDTIYTVINRGGNRYLKGKSGIEIDISYIPYSFRSYGERFFFDGLRYYRKGEDYPLR